LKGYSVAKTLEGQGLKVQTVDGENIDELYAAMCDAINYDGPAAVVCQRKMAVGIKGLEGSNHAHDAIKVYVHFTISWTRADVQ
jgi:transketolase